jgi:ABC-type transport system substrate-binding protein
MQGYWDSVLSRRLSRRRTIIGAASLGAGFVAAGVVGCSDGDDAPSATPQPEDTSGLLTAPVDSTKDAVRGGVWTATQVSGVEHFDALSGDDRTLFHTTHAYQRLLRYKPGTVFSPADGTVEGDAAASYELSNDGLQVTLKLRQDNRFDQRPPTSSRPMTVDDVKWSWERFAALSPSRVDVVNSINPDAPVESLSFPDNRTAVVKLASPHSAILKMLAYPWYLSIMPVEAESKFDFRQEMRGTGPWMLTNYTPSVTWEYRRNPNFFNKERPFLDGIDYHVIPEPAAQLAQFKARRTWQITPPAADVLALKREMGSVDLRADSPLTRQANLFVIGFSKMETTPFDDVRVRQAGSMLIDRDAWLETFFNVSKFQAEGIPFETAWHSHFSCSWPTVWLDPKTNELGEGSKYFHHNADDAAQLLRAAGRFGMETPYHIFTRGGFGGAALQTQLQVNAEMLQQGGHFKLKTEVHDYASDYSPNIMFGNKWEGIAGVEPQAQLPDEGLYLFSSWTPGGRNPLVGKQLPPQIHDLMVRHRREQDAKKRQALIHDWQRQMASHMPAAPFPGFATVFQLSQPWFANYGVYKGWNNSANPADINIHYWYDRAKQT